MGSNVTQWCCIYQGCQVRDISGIDIACFARVHKRGLIKAWCVNTGIGAEIF